MKKLASKVAYNRPNFFSVLPTGPESHLFCSIKMHDFYIRTLPGIIIFFLFNIMWHAEVPLDIRRTFKVYVHHIAIINEKKILIREQIHILKFDLKTRCP